MSAPTPPIVPAPTGAIYQSFKLSNHDHDSNFSLPAVYLHVACENFAKKTRHTHISTTILAYHLCKPGTWSVEGQAPSFFEYFVGDRLGGNFEEFQRAISQEMDTEPFLEEGASNDEVPLTDVYHFILERAHDIRVNTPHDMFTCIEHIALALIDYQDGQLLEEATRAAGVPLEKLKRAMRGHRVERAKEGGDPYPSVCDQREEKQGTLVNLLSITTDLSKAAERMEVSALSGREDAEGLELHEHFRNGGRAKQVVIIGPRGSGKTELVRTFTCKILDVNYTPGLRARVLQLDLDRLEPERGGASARLAEANMEITRAREEGGLDIILFIDDVKHANVNRLLPLLQGAGMRIILAAETDTWEDCTRKYASLESLATINLVDPDPERAFDMLSCTALSLQFQYSCWINCDIMKECLRLKNVYEPMSCNPGATSTLLREATILAQKALSPVGLASQLCRANLRLGFLLQLQDQTSDEAVAKQADCKAKIDFLKRQSTDAISPQDLLELYNKSVSDLAGLGVADWETVTDSTLSDRARVLVVVARDYRAKLREIGWSLDGYMEVMIKHVHMAAEARYKTNIAGLSEEMTQRLDKLESAMMSSVHGQKRAMKAIVAHFRRRATDVGCGNTPLGAWILAGPPGTGKSLTGEAMAEHAFGNPSCCYRISCGMYSDDLSDLLGNPTTGKIGTLTRHVRMFPRSVIIFDDIHRGTERMKNLLCDMVDLGQLREAGRRTPISCRSTVIFATTNVGQEILEGVKPGDVPTRQEFEAVQHALRTQLKPEIVERFKDVLILPRLSKAGIKQFIIANLERYCETQSRIHSCRILIDDDAVTALEARTLDPAQNMRWRRGKMDELLESAFSPVLKTRNATLKALIPKSVVLLTWQSDQEDQSPERPTEGYLEVQWIGEHGEGLEKWDDVCKRVTQDP